MRWTRLWTHGRNLAVSAAATIAVAVASVGGAAGQTYTTLSNSQITASVGVKDQVNSVNVAGRFAIQEAGTAGRYLMNLPLDSATALGSYVTVRVDGGNPADLTVDPLPPGWDFIWGDTDTLTAALGAWVQEPKVIGNKITAKWHTVADNTVVPRIPEIEVDLELFLVRDMVVYKFTVINKDSQAHSVGLRFVQDFNVGGTKDGPVVTTTGNSITNETELLSVTIPSAWRGVSDNTSANETVGATLRPSSAGTIPTVPGRVVYATTAHATVPVWDITPDPTVDFTQTGTDGSAALYFNPMQYGPGETKVISTTFGSEHGTYDFGQRLVAGIEGPVSLKYDPTQPVGKQLTPSPITLTGFLHNLNTVPLTSVRAVLSLPAGLVLAENETAAKTLPTIAAEGEGTVAWQVVPTEAASGRMNYAVSFSADPGSQGVSVTRDIDIPALPVQSLPAGIQMVSFPYAFADSTPSVALGLSTVDFDLIRWSSATGGYQAVPLVQPGQGYWLRLASAKTISLVDATPIKAAGGVVELKLVKGWNQIANPYLLGIRWGDLKVISSDVAEADYLNAIPVSKAADLQHQWIGATIFRYDLGSKSYAYDQDYSTEMKPYVGYWVKCLKNSISLLMTEPSGRAPAKLASSSVAPSGGWKLQLVASGAGTTDSCAYIGVNGQAADGYDLADVEKPPVFGNTVAISLLNAGWGAHAGSYAQDMKNAGAGRKTWTVGVASPAPSTAVTVSWPGVAQIVRGYELYAVDSTTGKRVSMRQVSSMVVNTGSEATAGLTIIAEPRSAAGGFRIADWSVVPSRARGSATISFTTTADATMSIRVVGMNGKTVRSLTSRAAQSGRTTSILWDYRDSAGTAVPSGAYTIEVRGVTPDGQAGRVVLPLVVVR